MVQFDREILWHRHGHLELLLPKRQRLQRGHHKALEFKQLPDFIHRLQNKNGMAALALEFLILSAARSGEVRNMTWAELNLDDLIWTIPADRMKAGREHRVPITNRMMEILETVSPSLFRFAASWCASKFL